ncbi:hypothetical protein JCM9157_4051 [Halalkalibacter akibai JCM 9157]|uniref:Cysteine-rich CPCC domain-containing protein n=1 Tax=Halalkalibacter akibai (strain ATCC 43226 / DSM 21942 / CIP 109018 / JCM 9157 / 1139) TaxID=1236973 RepID=W4QXH2_HALA3|nr:hypothetical protein JCM9157_4051 [Halalkalibacter akibai JCM 9157]
MKKDIDYYMSLDYSLVVSNKKDGYVLGEVLELPGCHTTADTEEKVLEELKQVMRDYIETKLELGEEIPEPKKYLCRCCNYMSLTSEIHDICPICYWQDDPACWDDPDFTGGANGDVSLRIAQKNYEEFGACEESMLDVVRAPTEKDIKVDVLKKVFIVIRVNKNNNDKVIWKVYKAEVDAKQFCEEMSNDEFKFRYEDWIVK